MLPVDPAMILREIKYDYTEWGPSGEQHWYVKGKNGIFLKTVPRPALRQSIKNYDIRNYREMCTRGDKSGSLTRASLWGCGALGESDLPKIFTVQNMVSELGLALEIPGDVQMCPSW